jgi:hypothetical protein
VSNGVSAFVRHLQAMDDTGFSTDAQVFQAAAAEVLSAARDPHRLARCARALNNASAWVSSLEESDAARIEAVRTLLDVIDALKQASPSEPDLDVEALAAMLNSRAHAAEVLRTLLPRPLAPKDIRSALGLEAAQLHRVLRWATSAGLLERSTAGGNVVYAVTRVGETALRGTDEPAWVQTAALLVELVARARLRGYPAASEDRRASALSGLSAPEAGRALAALEAALDPSVSSGLAAALGAAHSRPAIRIEQAAEAPPRAFALVCRALERAGIRDSFLQWWADDTPERATLHADALAHPLLSVGRPGRASLGSAVSAAFGRPVRFGRRSLSLRFAGSDTAETFEASSTTDFGVVARFYSPSTGDSHFLVGGTGSMGIEAAARTFYQSVERLLDGATDESFAVVVRSSGSGEACTVDDLRLLNVEDPHAKPRTRITSPVAVASVEPYKGERVFKALAVGASVAAVVAAAAPRRPRAMLDAATAGVAAATGTYLLRGEDAGTAANRARARAAISPDPGVHRKPRPTGRTGPERALRAGDGERPKRPRRIQRAPVAVGAAAEVQPVSHNAEVRHA